MNLTPREKDNTLIRMFQTADDAKQSAAAQNFVRDQAPVFLSPIVLAEFACTLRSVFRVDRLGISARLAMLIDTPEFTVPFPDAVAHAVERYGKGPADFADYLIGELNLSRGCDQTFTFDADAARSNPAFRFSGVEGEANGHQPAAPDLCPHVRAHDRRPGPARRYRHRH